MCLIPVKLCLQKQMAGLIWPTGLHLSTPGLSSEHDRFLTSKGFVMRVRDLIYVRWNVVNAINVSVIIVEITLSLNRKAREKHIHTISEAYNLRIYFFKTSVIDHFCV